MRRRLCISVLLAAGLAAGLTLAPAAAHASVDPYTMTNGFYVNPQNSAAVWSAANPSDGREPSIESAIATKPSALWFAGSGSEPIGEATGAYVGAAAYWDQLPVLVAYNITDRDICAGQSSGGAASDAAYDTWIGGFAGGIADRPAVVILEPDALADESCMTSAEISDRDGLLNNAITQFTNQAPETWVYLDAGNPGWLSAATMASYLNSAGLAHAHGFSLNVSSFYTDRPERHLRQRHQRGPEAPTTATPSRSSSTPAATATAPTDNWCNPSGMKLGVTDQVGGGAEALLWIKQPGESDGNCGTGDGTVAGQFVPQIAYDLVYGY